MQLAYKEFFENVDATAIVDFIKDVNFQSHWTIITLMDDIKKKLRNYSLTLNQPMNFDSIVSGSMTVYMDERMYCLRTY